MHRICHKKSIFGIYTEYRYRNNAQMAHTGQYGGSERWQGTVIIENGDWYDKFRLPVVFSIERTGAPLPTAGSLELYTNQCSPNFNPTNLQNSGHVVPSVICAVTETRGNHYNDVTMTATASLITILTIVYSTVYSSADQRKHQSSASLAFVREFTGDRWITRTNGQ